MKAGKVWGTTELIEANGTLEFHRIEMNKGGTCSKHLHRYKWNGFYVESGRLLIKVWQRDYELVDETILEKGMYTKVKPGLYHQFVCLERGVAYELYWAEFNHNDIERESIGFVKKENMLTGRLIEPEGETVGHMEDHSSVAGGSTYKVTAGPTVNFYESSMGFVKE